MIACGEQLLRHKFVLARPALFYLKTISNGREAFKESLLTAASLLANLKYQPLGCTFPLTLSSLSQFKHMRLSLSIPCLFLLFASCGGDAGTVSKKVSVEGRWELVEARKNNTKTGVVDGLHFEFRPDGSLETNLMGNESPGTYLKTGDEIITEGVKLPLTFSIQGLTDSTLHLRSKFREFQFDFLMARPEMGTEEIEL